jgi:phage gp46-like protein
MATPVDLRAWGRAIGWWADTVEDAATAAHMRKLADELEQLAAKKDTRIRELQDG